MSGSISVDYVSHQFSVRRLRQRSRYQFKRKGFRRIGFSHRSERMWKVDIASYCEWVSWMPAVVV